MKRNLRHRERGQALPEYALTIILVAVVVIAIAFGLGLAVQRIYGVVVAALGTKHDAVGVIEITAPAFCIAKQSGPPNPRTGLWIQGNTSEDVANLTGSTEQAVGTGVGGASYPVEDTGGGTFLWRPLLVDGSADTDACPKAVVIQSKTGAIAVSPVTVMTIP